MSTLISVNVHDHAYEFRKSHVVKRFTKWCEAQQEDRLLWVAIALAGHGCAITPITLYFVYLAGMNFTLFMTALVAMTIALVVNLAALPTKITIPALLLSFLVDFGVIATAIATISNS